ncbi:MAG: DUF2780 domain-containing protein [Acidobacteriota bacterium]
MNNIQEFIQLASSNLKTTPDTARSATGALLQFIQQKADPKDFQELTNLLPGSAELAKPTPAESQKAAAGTSPTGMLGNVKNLASSAMGGSSLGSGLQMADLLKNAGLSSDKFGPFVSTFLNFAKPKLGNELVTRILGKVPEFKHLFS